ncbi:MAG: hypothetical protein A3E94_00590 [Candidatus Zambryskibacteria bacterium RIFCSPHIGHO2_12_FULL_44_12b]|nr:MAG: hypothetical protein A3E94_00590 [Candidatus Zambryskibacteria bacterium RIFCSPHIGHO2_12_FULL_44_12b]
MRDPPALFIIVTLEKTAPERQVEDTPSSYYYSKPAEFVKQILIKIHPIPKNGSNEPFFINS